MRCTKPITVRRDAAGSRVKVRCGNCHGCIVSRQTAWSLRCLAETRLWPYARFLTLTYRDENLPPKLDYSDIQLWLKRWRKSHPVRTRFFCSGEYGSSTRRPHWHLLLWMSSPPAEDLGLGMISHRSWPDGFIHVSAVTEKTAGYVAKYSLKSDPHGEPALCRMSRRPGIGLPYLRWLGQWMATQQTHMEIPNSIRFGSNLLPLDRSAKRVLMEGFMSRGGVPLSSTTVLSDHLVAVAYERNEAGEHDLFNEAMYRKDLIRGAA